MVGSADCRSMACAKAFHGKSAHPTIQHPKMSRAPLSIAVTGYGYAWRFCHDVVCNLTVLTVDSCPGRDTIGGLFIELNINI